MPKKKLFNGRNYVGAYVDDETYRVLRIHSKTRNKSIADIIRAALSAMTKALNYPITQDKDNAIDGGRK